MIILAIILTAMTCVVGWALFLQPTSSNWDSYMYDEGQSFTDAGLEAEWGTPPPVTTNIAREGTNNVVYAMDVPVPPKPRQNTIIGVAPVSRRHVEGIKPMNRAGLADVIHEKLCKEECVNVIKTGNMWGCDCGAVNKYANTTSGLNSGISVGVSHR